MSPLFTSIVIVMGLLAVMGIVVGVANDAVNFLKRDKTCAKATPEEPKREQRMVCLMSEEEQRIVDRYLEKYKITNKSRWLRETILMFIHKNMEEDYPTLFGEHDMRR